MTIDLYGAGGEQIFSHHAWGYGLDLALDYGWMPQGTRAPEMTVYAPRNKGGGVDEVMTRRYRRAYESWEGDYTSNSHQLVTEEDAAALADALERALPHIPDEPTPAYLEARRVTYVLPPTEKEMRAWEEKFHAWLRAEGDPNRGAAPESPHSRCVDGPGPGVQELVGLDPSVPLTPIDYWSGESSKQRLQRFIEFCRAGSFSIH